MVDAITLRRLAAHIHETGSAPPEDSVHATTHRIAGNARAYARNDTRKAPPQVESGTRVRAVVRSQSPRPQVRLEVRAEGRGFPPAEAQP